MIEFSKKELQLLQTALEEYKIPCGFVLKYMEYSNLVDKIHTLLGYYLEATAQELTSIQSENCAHEVKKEIYLDYMLYNVCESCGLVNR